MNRRRRTEILVEGRPELRRDLAAEVARVEDILDIEPPRDGLVMIQKRESGRRSLFYLGELLVSEARVRLAGSIGLGIIAGDQPEAARDLAIVDAAFNASLPLTEEWIPRLLDEEDRLRRERILRERQILETRVSFDTMESE
jgi:alpha-D-ribose 1-methylphosphonate 5-triphosphate synthase subunit PhnG